MELKQLKLKIKLPNIALFFMSLFSWLVKKKQHIKIPGCMLLLNEAVFQSLKSSISKDDLFGVIFPIALYLILS